LVGATMALTASTGVAAAQSSPPPTVLQVLGETVTAPAPPLPRTGMDLGYAYAGAGLAAVGTVLVVAARRRKSTASTTPSSSGPEPLMRRP
jgi:LPXTG-motif cell wall-anchored protein